MELRTQEELEQENELLKQQLKDLTGSDKDLGALMALKHGMTHRLATILFILVKRSPAVISRDTFHSIMYGDRSDGGPEPKIFAVHISRLRSILKRLADKHSTDTGKIDTVWGAGYRANPQLVKWVHNIYAQHKE